jgi:hypothetical protein
MTINESVKGWIEYSRAECSELEPIQVMVSGDHQTQEMPFVGIYETGAELYEQDGVTMYGVTVFEITVELFTVPADADEGGTNSDEERKLRDSLYQILGDRAAIDWINSFNQDALYDGDSFAWSLFDIRTASPTTIAEEGQRITRFILSITACPKP